MPNVTEKRPRQWAQEIAALKTLEERRRVLAKLDSRDRMLVQAHLKIIWGRRMRHGRG